MGISKIPIQFAIEGTLTDIRKFGSGHIHDTYAVSLDLNKIPGFLLQRINTHVFKDVPAMMENISLVTTHLAHTIKTGETDFQTLQLIPTKGGDTYLTDKNDVYRMYKFLYGLNSYDILPTTKLVKECGKGYGRFISLLSDLPAERLNITIPKFHEIGFRLHQLEEAKGKSNEDTNGLYGLVQEMAGSMVELDARDVPIRVTHNDTKSNNILFNKSGKSVCVVDLDTVMPGKIWYDTGDSLRTLLSQSAEDADKPEMSIQEDYFDAFLLGYLEETAEMLTEAEWGCIPLSGAYMAYIMGVRFLTDHLNGDVYYKTDYRGHNLKRAGNQLALAFRLLGMEDELNDRMEKIREELSRK